MNKLLVQQPLNVNITKEEFIEDINCLFQNIKELYGMYDYYGDAIFDKAYRQISNTINNKTKFDFYESLNIVKEELAFIKDGHFYIGESKEIHCKYDYAIKYSTYKNIELIDCKKFYFDNEFEKEQLIEFSRIGSKYKNDMPLIIDLRDNAGGSSIYIYDFLVGLLDCEDIGYSHKYIQRCSNLYLDWLKKENYDWNPLDEESVYDETFEMIPNRKKIYVLINEATGSAAEEAIAYLKNIENVTIVGSHSNGSFSCGNCIDFYLPNSHLKVYFGTGLVLYKGTINIDFEGGFKGDISYEHFTKLELIDLIDFYYS